jgi:NAD(P)-dependent dehydrogenase (short-subunit alcohol dehydrogenase family)
LIHWLDCISSAVAIWVAIKGANRSLGTLLSIFLLVLCSVSMAQYTKPLSPDSLQGKVIVVTGTPPVPDTGPLLKGIGGANGIGASLVEYAVQNGASVCFGDVSVQAGEEIARAVNTNAPSSAPRAIFVHTDVTKYDSVLGLFDRAMEVYGRIDHAVAGAGIVEIGNVFDPALDMQSIREASQPGPSWDR